MTRRKMRSREKLIWKESMMKLSKPLLYSYKKLPIDLIW
ncbi:hypothetical protein CJF30_00000220 [Rutstroemia sp. NJR-2017a BBW]|nr:hypothetical protein CJF30_00000220 [Rutstroemia sp. NJR-2017a BBW]